MKRFNTTGVCIPEKHYMADTSEKIYALGDFAEEGFYFTINRPRQYGKTTSMFLLEQYLLKKGYLVIKISFEGVGDVIFQDEQHFASKFFKIMSSRVKFTDPVIADYLDSHSNSLTLKELSDEITAFIKYTQKKVVLEIDEVDKSSNNQLFLSFIGMLRDKYLLRNEDKDETFHSVILAGVHDVKTLKAKIRSDQDAKLNSPWNIAIDIKKIDLSLNSHEIQTMLDDYFGDYPEHRFLFKCSNSQPCVSTFANELYRLTSGYPFLVSRLCQIIAEDICPEGAWTPDHLRQATKLLLQESNTNFDSLIKNLENNPDLYQLVYQALVEGKEIAFNIQNPLINLGVTYGVFQNNPGLLKIHNRIYEQLIFDYMSSKTETSISTNGYNFRGNFINSDNSLDFEKILLKFQAFMKEQYSEHNTAFLERDGRLIFLAFLKPIINGKGFDFKEVQIAQEKRLDVVVTYGQYKYIVELKIWYGPQYHKEGLVQLAEYLDAQGVDCGYLIVFDTKSKEKGFKKQTKTINGKRIFGVWV